MFNNSQALATTEVLKKNFHSKLYTSNQILFLRILSYDTYITYHERRGGVLSAGSFFNIFLPTTEESMKNDYPEIQLFGLPHLTTLPDYQKSFNFDEDYWTNFLQPGLKGKYGFSYFNCLLRPKSR